jgi:hypothetical protein
MPRACSNRSREILTRARAPAANDRVAEAKDDLAKAVAAEEKAEITEVFYY